MFISVAISPEAIESASKERMGLTSDLVRKELIGLIKRYGTVMVPSIEERKALAAAITSKSLTQHEQTTWKTFLTELMKINRFVAATPEIQDFWEHASNPATYQSLSRSSALLSILSADSYERTFADGAGLRSVADNIEIATPVTASLSHSAKKLTDLLDSGIFDKGTSREEVWGRLLGPLASSSKQIVIFDPYLYSRLWKESTAQRPRKEHMEWILEKIDQLPPMGRHVTLVGAAESGRKYGSPGLPDRVLDMLEGHFNGAFQSIAEVSAFVVPTSWDMHHDRHVYFSSGHAVEIPAGADRLGTAVLKDSMGFTYRHTPQSLQELERRVAEAQEARGTVWSRIS